jgi:hypothetical protein
MAAPKTIRVRLLVLSTAAPGLEPGEHDLPADQARFLLSARHAEIAPAAEPETAVAPDEEMAALALTPREKRRKRRGPPEA